MTPASLLLLLVLRGAAMTVAAFSPIWNAPTVGCNSYHCGALNASNEVHPARYDIQSNPNMTFFGSEMKLFYSMGEFPRLSADIEGTPCWVHDRPGCLWNPWRNITAKLNGGVPQKANLTLHLDQVKKDVEKNCADANYDKLLIIDWEAWFIPFYMNYDSLSLYQVYSEDLVKQEHPEWADNATKVEEAAADAFNAAAQTFWVETVRTIKKMRPNAKVGFYIYPVSAVMSTELLWLWKEIDVLCPSYYASIAEHNATAAFNQVKENMDAAIITREVTLQATNNTHDLIIAPYALSGVFLALPPTPLSPMQAGVSYFVPMALGAQHVVMWGGSDSTESCDDCGILAQAWASPSFGYQFKSCVAATRKCGEGFCGGNGVCVKEDYSATEAAALSCPFDPVLNNATGVTCRCRAPFSGQHCEKTLL